MEITARQRDILNKLIREYIASAKPVSSQLLKKKHRLKISSATIRIEMRELTEEGFIFQPYPSAGRIPTDKGYRFFVDSLLEKEILEFEKIIKVEKILTEAKEDILRLVSNLTKFLARESSNLVVFYLWDKDLLWKEGWREILKKPEFRDEDYLSNFVEFLENFEKNIKNFKINSEIKIYIGKENPLEKAKDFSIIFSKCRLKKDKKGIISLIGPKRMAYEKNISLINSLTKLLEK